MEGEIVTESLQRTPPQWKQTIYGGHGRGSEDAERADKIISRGRRSARTDRDDHLVKALAVEEQARNIVHPILVGKLDGPPRHAIQIDRIIADQSRLRRFNPSVANRPQNGLRRAGDV